MRDLVAGEQRGAAIGEQELVQVAGPAVAGVDARERRVRGVGDHVVPDPVPELDNPLPPGQRRATAVGLDAEVGRDESRERLLPDRLAGVVDDHRTGLSVVGRVVWREEDQARSDTPAERRHAERRDPQVGARVIGRRSRRDGWLEQGTEGARDMVARSGERERAGAHAPGNEKLASGEPPTGLLVSHRLNVTGPYYENR